MHSTSLSEHAQNGRLSEEPGGGLGAFHVTQKANWETEGATARFIKERLNDFKIHRGRGLDRSQPDTVRNLSALRAVVVTPLELHDCLTLFLIWDDLMDQRKEIFDLISLGEITAKRCITFIPLYGYPVEPNGACSFPLQEQHLGGAKVLPRAV